MLRALHRVIGDLNLARDLAGTLRAVVDGAVSGLGFGAAAVHIVRSDGDLQTAAVAGGPGVSEALGGAIGERASWENLLAAGERWGALRFVRGPLAACDQTPALPTWMPDVVPIDDPEAWLPEDALLAPLHAPDGELVGVLSVDLPPHGLRPDAWRRELLEMFAAQAAIAIDNARLRTETLLAMARLEREQRALRASEESFRQAFENAPSGMAMTSLLPHDHGTLLRVNDALTRMLGYPSATLCRFGLLAFAHPEDRAVLAEHGEAPGRTEVRLIRSDGAVVWVSLRASVVCHPGGGSHFLLTHVEDIEDRKRHEQTLAHQATHDALTGLPNVAELHARMAAYLASQARLAVLFCDLDGFKAVNDEHGHLVGDGVLAEVARRLAGAVREIDTVARVGGDEFVVLAVDVSPAQAADLADRLAGALAEPVLVDGRQVVVGGSFGVSWAEPGSTPEDLLRQADSRMYAQKRGRARAAVPQPATVPGPSQPAVVSPPTAPVRVSPEAADVDERHAC
jgi:diguanylate cyclase (GGDEF)-like protein/PAS domain S-box-containing protein